MSILLVSVCGGGSVSISVIVPMSVAMQRECHLVQAG